MSSVAGEGLGLLAGVTPSQAQHSLRVLLARWPWAGPGSVGQAARLASGRVGLGRAPAPPDAGKRCCVPRATCRYRACGWSPVAAARMRARSKLQPGPQAKMCCRRKICCQRKRGHYPARSVPPTSRAAANGCGCRRFRFTAEKVRENVRPCSERSGDASPYQAQDRPW